MENVMFELVLGLVILELLNKINEVLEKLIEEGKIEEFVINHSS